MKREWTDLELAEHWTLLPAGSGAIPDKWMFFLAK
jgi:hypothetical protein